MLIQYNIMQQHHNNTQDHACTYTHAICIYAHANLIQYHADLLARQAVVKRVFVGDNVVSATVFNPLEP